MHHSHCPQLPHLPPGKFLWCMDSQSTIQGLQSPDLTYPHILELYTTSHTLFKWDFSITPTWLPGHVCISSNKAADAAARDSTAQCTLVPSVLSLYFKTALRWCIVAKWQQNWDHTWGSKLQDVKSVTLPWRSFSHSICRDEVVVTCLRVGQPSSVHQPTLCVCPLSCRSRT
jgi:hypothetical protein